MKKAIYKSLKIIVVGVVLCLFIGCEKDELPCEKVVQGDFVIVE